MYDKKIPIRHNREETIEIIVFIGPINFQINIHIFAKKTTMYSTTTTSIYRRVEFQQYGARVKSYP